MNRTRKSLSILVGAAMALILTLASCGGPKGPSAQINATAFPTVGGTEYPKQDLTFTADKDNVLSLRIHLFDDYCKSFRANLQVKSIKDSVAARELKTSKILELDHDYYDWLDSEDEPVCEKAEGNLDVKLAPGTYVLVVDEVSQPVNITVLPHKS